MEAFTEGINELFSGIGESISETLTTSFEGIGETFTGFTDSITENLTSALDGLSEYFSGFGEAIQSSLTATFSNAATMLNCQQKITLNFNSRAGLYGNGVDCNRDEL